jgi:enediyne biosynthesis protein E4
MLRAHNSLPYIFWLLIGVMPLVQGCTALTETQQEAKGTATPVVVAPADTVASRFVDVALSAGIRYRWQVPEKRPLNILQTIGNGCAFLDYDNDDNLDIMLIGKKLALYRGDGKGQFTDMTASSGVGALTGDFRGCAVGDYDNDGWDDIYISAYRGGVLLHNERGASFRDVTKESGMTAQPWGSACAFGDIDADGLLDLYVGNYVRFGPDTVQLCKVNDHLTACSPQNYDAEKGVLYKNRGKGRFDNVTKAWGADNVHGKALGVAFADYDNSGLQSITIANDEVAGDLLQNNGKRLENVGQLAGTAYAATGRPHAGMGTDWGDFNNDGRLDLVVTTFALENKAVYENEGNNMFTEKSTMLGVALPTMPYVSFGVKWLDFDNDGWLDLIIASGHTSDNIAAYDKGRTYRQPTLLLRNERGLRFLDISKDAGTDFARPIVGRGLATGDYDNDGRVDALVVDSEGTPLLLHNETANAGRFLSVRLEGKKANRNGFGAQLVVSAAGQKYTRFCHTDGSFFSASDRRVHIGVGEATTATLTVRWPGGKVDSYRDLPTNRRYLLQEGASEAKVLL